MNEVFVALGSNLGDRLGNLGLAADRLAREPGFCLRKLSHSYETEPIGPPQPRYLNAVAQVGSLLSPRATLQKLQAIEESLGRVRRERWGSREIDLDLLLFGERVIAETGLVVPHPLIAQRAFVLVPLAEIAPLAVHPVLRQPARLLAQSLPTSELVQVRRYKPIRRSLDDPEDPSAPPESPA